MMPSRREEFISGKNTPRNLFGLKRHAEHSAKNFRSGFTLIELLTVISIVALIFSIGLAALNQARAEARDAKLLADIKAVATALDFYYNDNGRYPPHQSDAKLAGNAAWWGWPMMTSFRGDATDPVLKGALTSYLSYMPNPGMVQVPYWKFNTTISRINYNLPVTGWEQLTDVGCPAGWFWQAGSNPGKCYVLHVVTETDTPLGPANTVIALINGKIRYVFDDEEYASWGFW